MAEDSIKAVDNARKEMERTENKDSTLSKLVSTYTEKPSLGNVDEVSDVRRGRALMWPRDSRAAFAGGVARL